MRKKITLAIFYILSFSIFNEGKATDYFLQSSGAITNLLSWNTSSTGIGTPPLSFIGAADVWHITNRTGLTVSHNIGPFSIASTATLVIEQNNHLNVTSTGAFPNSPFIDIASDATLTIGNGTNYNLNKLDLNSTVRYNTSQTAVKTLTVPYGNLTIATSQSIAGTAGFFSVDGLLTINSSRTFSLNGNYLFLGSSSVQVAGTGSICGDANAALILTNGVSGNNGTINFSSNGQTLFQFALLYSSSSSFITLGTDLTITGSGSVLDQSFGGLSLNGNSLFIDSSADISFPASSADGDIRGNSNSSIIIEGTVGQLGGATGTSLFMNSSQNTLKSLVLDNSGASLDIGTTLNITDSLSVISGILTTGGNVTLKSTSSLKGRLGLIGGTLSGNLRVETFVPGGTTGWANLGTNGISGLTVSNWDAHIPMTCTGCSNPTTAVLGGFASMVEWDEVSDSYITCSNTTPLTLGKGFWVYVGSAFATTTDFTFSDAGTPKTGSGTIPITETSTNSASPNYRSNLIANPYASPVSWTKWRALGSNSTLANTAIYVWNADLSGSGMMTTYIAGASSPGGGAIGDDIPAGQGFFVEALTSGNLVYDESIKTAANTSTTPLLRTSAINNNGKIFRLVLNGANDWDATVFRIHKDATPFFDNEWDAHKIFQSPGYAGYPGVYNHYTTISSKDAVNDDYSIHSIPSLSENVSIPLLVKVSASGTYTIEGSDLEDVGDCVLLNDNLLHTTTNLKESNYVFSMDDTTSTPRFDLILCKPFGAAPVSIKELTYDNSITISQDQQGAFVKTAFEENTKAVISAYNLLGQKVMNDVEVNGTVNTTHLNLNLPNQVVFIKVSTDKESSAKKIVLH